VTNLAMNVILILIPIWCCSWVSEKASSKYNSSTFRRFSCRSLDL